MTEKEFQELEARKKESCRVLAEKRAFFCERFPKNGVIVEIGALWGQFSEVILRVAKPKLLILVDPWMHDDKFGDRTPEQMDAIAKGTLEKFKNTGNVFTVRDRSSIFFESFIDAYQMPAFDCVYIDGDHEYEGVLEDLKNSWKCVKPDGLITGDDYGENITWWKDSVKRAVDDFCRFQGVIPEIIDVPGEKGKQFLIRR